ncbi:MAG TPA: RHS repeat-associated core domain-containing protein [Candidatus Tectomicrobia bacterium]|nr:RHS repeat-associated core domain-containing protein [Candidatus Tectomicrobia bacterium]
MLTTDRLGSVRTLAQRDGTWLLTRRWTPYGVQLAHDSSASFTWSSRLRYGWTGREYDTETGLYFHRARYYAPTVGRFIQEDPVESSTSAYAYVNGSPLEATDPSGMIMSYEVRMTDYRMDELLAPQGPSALDLSPELGHNAVGGWE